MSAEITFFVDTTRGRFREWLVTETACLHGHRCPARGGGEYRLKQAGWLEPPLPLLPNKVIVSIEGIYIPECDYVEEPSRIPGDDYIPHPSYYIKGSDIHAPTKIEAMRFELAVPRDKQTVVATRCSIPEVADYWGKWLREIMWVWPKAKEQILAPESLEQIQSCVSDAEWAKWEPLVEASRRQKPAEDGAGKRGRPTLTKKELEERAEKVEKVLRTRESEGITLEQACAREGIPYPTFRDWRKRTKKDE